MSIQRRTWRIAGVLVVALGATVLLAPGVTRAGEETRDRAALRESVQDLVHSVRAHRRTNDVYELAEDVWRVVRLHRDAADVAGSGSYRRVMVRLVGLLTRHPDERIHPVALDALGEMGDPSALDYVKPFLKPSRCAEIDRTKLAAIEAAATLKGECCVYNLIGIMRRSDCPCEAMKAIIALGAFRNCDKHQARILEIIGEEIAKQEEVLRNRPPTRARSLDGISAGVMPVRREPCPAVEAAMKRAALLDTMRRLTVNTQRAVEEWLRFFRKGEQPFAE